MREWRLPGIADGLVKRGEELGIVCEEECERDGVDQKWRFV